MKKVIISALFLICNLSSAIYGCSIGMATGKATTGGSPILWKTQDYEVKNDTVKKCRIIKLENFPDNGIHNGKRTIEIALPPDYFVSDQKYRVMYFFDGERVFTSDITNPHLMGVNYYHDQLLEEDLIYPTIFVAIHNNGNRFVELTPTKGEYKSQGGELDQFYKFIHKELKPYIDSNFRTLKEAKYTGIAGGSLGGLAAAYVSYSYPATFGMAGCMCSSLWWDNELMLKLFNKPYKAAKPRFWIMSADIEYPAMWQQAHQAAKILADNGWVEEENLAYYHVYGGHHDTKSLKKQMRNMLYFLLRKNKPKPIDAVIKNIKSSDTDPVDIENLGEYANILLELNYTNGFRTNAISTNPKIDNENIVVIEDKISGRLIPKSEGWTTVSMRYKNFQSSAAIKSYNFTKYDKKPIKQAGSKVKLDGILEEWHTLTYRSKECAADSLEYFSFDLSYDDQFIYLALNIIDDTTFVDTTHRSYKRDKIIVYLDARLDPYRCLGRGLQEWDEIHLIEVSPGTDLGDMILKRDDFYRNKLPEDLEVACTNTKDGYSLEIRIPVSYISERQGENWREFRINICQKDIDNLNGEIKQRWWQPAWNSEENYNGSGTFKKYNQ